MSIARSSCAIPILILIFVQSVWQRQDQYNNKMRLKFPNSRFVYWNLISDQRGGSKTKLLFQTTGLNSCLNKKQRKINQFRSNLIYLLKASGFVGRREQCQKGQTWLRIRIEILTYFNVFSLIFLSVQTPNNYNHRGNFVPRRRKSKLF